MKLTGWDYISVSTDIDEKRLPKESASEYVSRLAREKAIAAMQLTPIKYILAADTIVVDEDVIYGKPSSLDDAARILRLLRGHNHIVMTAIALFDRFSQNLVTDLCKSSVPMRSYSEEEIAAYISSGDALDKAGAYAIQNTSFHPVSQFIGCFASVMGMPLCHLGRTALKLGLTPSLDLPENCQKSLNYKCSIHEAVFRGDIIG